MTTYTIGRSQQNDIVINDKSVSRQHAELRASKNGEFLLVDLDSTNGTCVREGSRWVEIEKATVDHGERVLIGEVITTVTALLTDMHRKADAGKRDSPGRRAAAPAPPTPPKGTAAMREPSFGQRCTPSGRPIAEDVADGMNAADAPMDGQRSLNAGPRSVVDPDFDDVPEAEFRGRRWPVVTAVAVVMLVFMSAGTYAFLNYGDDLFASAVDGAKKLGVKKLGPGTQPKPRTWQKIIGGDKTDVAHAIATTGDGGFLLAGTTNSRGVGQYDLWVVRLDQDGKTLWQKTYGGRRTDEFAIAIQRVRKGFILAGTVQAAKNNPKKQARIWAVKLDGKGNKEWDRTISGNRFEFTEAVIGTRDGGYAVTAYSYATNPAQGRTRVIKLDAGGRIQWSHYYGEGTTKPSDIQHSHDGGYIIAGTAHPADSGRSALWTLRLGKNGRKVWERAFPRPYNDFRPRIRRARGRQYIIAASAASIKAKSGLAQPHDVRLLRLDDRGEKIWEHKHTAWTADRVSALVLIRGGIIVAGGSDLGSGQKQDLWIARFDTKGRLVWQRRYGGPGHDIATDIRQRRGGFILAGKISQRDGTNTDAWVLKLDQAGRLGN